jgi:ABC-type antimicrobial peptide transport system permease subunit
MGAQTGDIVRWVARRVGIPVVAGLALGAGCALAFEQTVSGLMYGMRRAEAEMLLWSGLVLLVAAGMAMWAPARRASSIDPMAALREE